MRRTKRRVRANLWKWLVSAPLALGACAHQTTAPTDLPAEEYRIGREDVLEIAVWKDPALSTVAPVRPDGRVSVPMLKDVQAEGKTPQELGKEIATKLSPWVQDPIVSVNVREVNSTKFSILGEVAHPGVYPVRGTVSILQAVALAGGLTEFASPGSIVLIRRDPKGKEQRYAINYHEVVKGELPGVPKLKSGDTVYVP